MSVTNDPRAVDLRPARRTDRLGLPVPGDGGPADYVTATGALADAIDRLFQPGDLKVSASLEDAAGAWLLCDGRAVGRSAFLALFRAIDTRYGAGDGSATFNLPNMIGRMPIGADGRAVYGGEAAHALTVAEMAHHNHPVSDPGHAHGVADGGHAHSTYGRVDFMGGAGGQWYAANGWGVPGGATGVSGVGVGIYGAVTGIYIVGEGGGQPHNNTPPFAVMNFFIKT